MISTSQLVLDGHHAHGLGPGPGPGPGGPHHMAFVDPYLRSKLQPTVPEFIRPLPKPAPLVPRCGAQRPSPSQSPRKEYQSVPVSSTAPSSGPVNLTSIKHDSDNISDSQISRTSGNMQIPHLAAAAYTSRMFPHPGFHYPGLQTYGSLYTSPYSLLNRPTYINSTPLSPLERQYSPPQSASSNNPAAFLPPGGYSNQNTPPQPHGPPPLPPPPVAKPGQSLLREKRPFKVPPEKDVSSKPHHQPKVTSSNNNKNSTKRMTLPSNVNNNNLLPPNFTKGSLIQLANGVLRRVEEVTTEELVSCADRCPGLRIDPATVVRIEENNNGTVLLTLSYGENKRKIEIESTLEHPYYVYGQGWASCSPERTMNYYGLQCHPLQVGDICISLSPAPNQPVQQQQQQQQQQHHSPQQQQQQRSSPHQQPRSNSVKSTAQISNSPQNKSQALSSTSASSYQSKPVDSNQYSPPGSRVDGKQEEDRAKSEGDFQSDEERNAKRRRWSAPDQLDAEDEYIDPGSPSPSQKRMKEDTKTVN